MSQPPVLGYWNIRGLVHAIRLLFHYCGEDYVEELYEAAPDPSKESWFNVKFSKGLDFPNFHRLRRNARTSFHRLIFNPDSENLKQGFLDDLPVKLQMWSNYLSEKPWLTGEMINYPDFYTYDLLDALRTLEPTSLDKFPNLKDYMNRFEDLKPIKEFQKSDVYMARPFYNFKAAWRGDT
ncbi:Glutathione S-transferase Mu 4 [Sparganum proliferum]